MEGQKAHKDTGSHEAECCENKWFRQSSARTEESCMCTIHLGLNSHHREREHEHVERQRRAQQQQVGPVVSLQKQKRILLDTRDVTTFFSVSP